MENLDRKKLWDLDATSPLHSSAPSTVEDYAQHETSHTRSNTDASNVGEYATSSSHSQQSTPTADYSGKSSNVTTINHHYSSSTNEVTLIDLSMPPPPLPPPLPAATKAGIMLRAAAAHGTAFSGTSSSAASTDGPASSISLTGEGGMFNRPSSNNSNGLASNGAQNYFRSRDHAYSHQSHPPVHPLYPPLQQSQHYNASVSASASASMTNLASSLKNSRSRSIDSKPQQLVRRPESTKPSASSTSSATSSAAVCTRSASLTHRISLSNKISRAAQQLQPSFQVMNTLPSKRFSINGNVGPVTVFSNSSSAMMSPRSLSSTTLPISAAHVKAQTAITDELKARNFMPNNTANFTNINVKSSTSEHYLPLKMSDGGRSRNSFAVPKSVAATSSATTTLMAVQTVTTNSLQTEAFKQLPASPAPLINTVTDKNIEKSDRNSPLTTNADSNRSERAAASVKQIIQTIEQQLLLNDNLADADKQLDDLEKALEAGSPTSDSGGNYYPPSLDATSGKHYVLDTDVGGGGDDDTDACHHHEAFLPPICNSSQQSTAAAVAAAAITAAAEPSPLPFNNGRSTTPSTATTTANHMQQGQRLLRMIYAEKQRTNAERDKLKRAIAERDMYRDHYVSICEGSKWRRMQYEELESKFELLQTENAELRKKVSKHRHKKRRATLEVDSQIAVLQQQYAEELKKQKQKRHHEKKLRLKQEKELQQFAEQQTQQQPVNNNAAHEKCQQAAQLAVKTAVQNVKKKYDAEIEELEIQNVALMLENRDLKHVNTSLRHGLNEVEQKLVDSQRTGVKSVATELPPPSPPLQSSKITSKSLPNSPQKASTGVQTDKTTSAPSSPKARDVSTSTTKLNSASFVTPANHYAAKLSKLTFESSPLVRVGVDQPQQPSSSKHSSAVRLTPPRQKSAVDNNNISSYDDAGDFSAIYSDGEKAAGRAALRQSFASSTPTARHSQPLLPPSLPTSHSKNNTAVKPASSSHHAELLRSLSSQHDGHPVGALRQQLLQHQQQRPTRQIYETSFTNSTPRTLVREVASDDYMRAAYMLASTTNHPSGPPNLSGNASSPQFNKSHTGADMLSSGATVGDGDDETEQQQSQNDGGENTMRRRDETLTGTSSTGSEQQQQQQQVSSAADVNNSATRKRQSRRHVYDLMEDNTKSHGDDGCSPFRARKNQNGVAGPLVLPKGVASVAARRLERKVALLKGGWNSSSLAASGAAGPDDFTVENNNKSRSLKATISAPFYNPPYGRKVSAGGGLPADVEAANTGTSV